MKTPIKEAIDNIRDYRDLGTSDYDTCNTILFHLAILLEKEKKVIIDAFNEGEDLGDRRNYTGDKYYNEIFNNEEI